MFNNPKLQEEFTKAELELGDRISRLDQISSDIRTLENSLYTLAAPYCFIEMKMNDGKDARLGWDGNRIVTSILEAFPHEKPLIETKAHVRLFMADYLVDLLKKCAEMSKSRPKEVE